MNRPTASTETKTTPSRRSLPVVRGVMGSMPPVVASLILFMLSLALPINAFAQKPTTGLDSIRAEELRAKLTHFASDEFRGRGNGTPALDEAARYIAGVFEENGLKPIAAQGFFQDFKVERLTLGEANTFRLAGASSVTLKLGRDFVPYSGSDDGEVVGPMIFVGYGIRAPGLNYDDLAAVDVAGHVVVVLDGHPEADDRASPFNLRSGDISGIRTKAKNVEQAGGIGLIVVQGPLDRNPTSLGYLADSLKPGLSPRRSTMDLRHDSKSAGIPVVIVSRSSGPRVVPGLEAMQRSINRSLQPRFSRLSAEAILGVELRRDTYTAHNVIGWIEGSDPVLRDEVIVVGAHYDHDGEENGTIWNGADDDGSGTTALMELAEAFGSDGPSPARSVILAAWAGEEKGMLGSRYYVRNPILPVSNTVAMFQMDMIGRNEDHGANRGIGVPSERASENGNTLNVVGSVFSPDMRQMVSEANDDVGLELQFRYDYRGDDLIKRSDSWSFLSGEVPSLFLFAGFHGDYHRPSDTADKINYPKLEKVVRLVYLSLMEIGNANFRPLFTNPSPQ